MKLQILVIFIVLGAGNHLFFNKEITLSYVLKKCIIPIIITVGICYLLSLFIKNIYIVTFPIWMLVGIWTILGYYEYYKLCGSLYNNYKNKKNH